jgi:hypothetical protein
VLQRLIRDRPGWSAQARHDELARRWRRRFFGRRLTALVWTAVVLLTLFVARLHASRHVELLAGMALGMTIVTVTLFPSLLRPGWIGNWQQGAWGEEMTASELKRLRRKGWLVRHDLRWGEKGNHDHLLVGDSVYVLNTKNFRDCRVTVEGDALRVSRLDDENDGYLSDGCIPQVEREARGLKSELSRLADTSVHVYPVIVVWGEFPPERAVVGDVTVVHGAALVNWIEGRQADLLNADRRDRVVAAAAQLPAATEVRWRDVVRRPFAL